MAKKPSLDDVWGISDPPPARQERIPRSGRRTEPEAERVSPPPAKPTSRQKRSAPAAKGPAAAPAPTPDPPEEEKPVRMTVYLDPQVVSLLDRSQMELKRLTGLRGHATSNSAVIEECVRHLLAQFLEKPGSSQLPSLISKREAERQKNSGKKES